MIRKMSLLICRPESTHLGIVTESCSGINQALSIFLSFMIRFLVISFATLELVTGLAQDTSFKVLIIPLLFLNIK